MENNLSDKIDSYLDGKMSAEEKSAFEKELSNNESLRQQVEMQQNLRAGIDRMNLKSTISSQFRKMTLKSKIYKWGITTVAITAIATAAYFSYNKFSGNSSANNYTLPQLNEQGKPEWANADKNLPTQTFSIDPNKDTVLETDGGIVFAIPAGAFLDAKEPVTLEVREALNAMDIMKGGLSTTSDGKLLETGGMFYLNARNGDQSLKINPAKPIYANVPTNEIKPDMMVFDGERKPDGSVNWTNPKKIEKQLIPVDINSLDFYPKGFREKVAELGFDANNKKVTDSIYYSYAGRKDFAMAAKGTKTSIDSARVRHILISYKGAERAGEEITRTKEQAKSLADNILKDIKSGKVKMENIVEKYTDDPGSKTGNKGDYGWFTEESGFVQEFKDAGFKNPKGATVICETSFGYHIIQVLDQSKPSTKYLDESGEIILGNSDSTICLEINPARISAIWNDKFQNTIIATKEFEERLQVIFQIYCTELREPILNLYLQNLNKPMYQIDSMADLYLHFAQCRENSSAGWHESNTEFYDFYLRHDGGISVTDSHMKELQNYFNLKRKAVQQASEKTFADRMKKEQAEDKNYSATKAQQSADDEKRDADNFNKELDINLTEACRQLGIPPMKNMSSPNYSGPIPNDYYGVTVTNPGWCNIDRCVEMSTQNRTTIDYTDSQTGKKALIKYEPVTITITDSKNYDQLTVYLVPDSLNSFMKVNDSAGKYSEKLNELFHYSLVVIGQKGDKSFWAKRNNIKPENIDLHLEEIGETQLKTELNTSFSTNVNNDFKKEMDVMKEEHDYKIQTQARKKQEEIDAAIMPVIFPFYFLEGAPAGGAAPQPNASHGGSKPKPKMPAKPKIGIPS
jgi:parvulin-like peptidyl-prolyl isomerase